MGKKHADEMNIWTQEEFGEVYRNTEPMTLWQKTGFLILFWGGLRIGELTGLNQR